MGAAWREDTGPGPVCAFAGGPDATRQEAGYRWLVLPRHGRRPLAVRGRTLLMAKNDCCGLPWSSTVTLHETGPVAGRFALTIRHAARADHAPAWVESWLADDAAAARALLCGHDPVATLPVRDATAEEVSSLFSAAWADLLRAVLGASPTTDRHRCGPDTT